MPRGTSPQHIESMMFDYLADALEPDARLEFEEFLADSPEWTRRLERERTFERNLHAVGTGGTPAGLADRIKANARARLAVPIATANDDPNFRPTATVVDLGAGSAATRRRPASRNSGRGMLLLAASLVVIMSIVVSQTAISPKEKGLPKVQQRQTLALTGSASNKLNASPVGGAAPAPLARSSAVAPPADAQPFSSSGSGGAAGSFEKSADAAAAASAEHARLGMRRGQIVDTGRDVASVEEAENRREEADGDTLSGGEPAKAAMTLEFKQESLGEPAATPPGGGERARELVVDPAKDMTDATPTPRPVPTDNFNVSPLKPRPSTAVSASRGHASPPSAPALAKEDVDRASEIAAAGGPAAAPVPAGEAVPGVAAGRPGEEVASATKDMPAGANEDAADKKRVGGVGGGVPWEPVTESSGDLFGLPADARGAERSEVAAVTEASAEPSEADALTRPDVTFAPPDGSAIRELAAAPTGSAGEALPTPEESAAVDVLVEALEAGGLHVISRGYDVAAGATTITVLGLEQNLTTVLRPPLPGGDGTEASATNAETASTPYSYFASQSEVWSADTYFLAQDAEAAAGDRRAGGYAAAPDSYDAQIKGGARVPAQDGEGSGHLAKAKQDRGTLEAAADAEDAADARRNAVVVRRALYPDELPFLRVVWERTEIENAAQMMAGMMSNRGSQMQNSQAYFDSQAGAKNSPDQLEEVTPEQWQRMNEEYQTSTALSFAPPVAQTFELRVTAISATK